MGIINPAAAAFPFTGALVTKLVDQIGGNYTVAAAIAWDSTVYDTSGFHDNAIQNSRLVIPVDPGFSRVQLRGGFRLNNITASVFAIASITKNGSTVYAGSPQSGTSYGDTGRALTLSSAVLNVVAGDYFEFLLQVQTDTAVDLVAARTWFSIQALGA